MSGDARLGAGVRDLVVGSLVGGALRISAISFCEVAWLQRAGRLALPFSPRAWRASVLAEGVRETPLHGDVAIAAAEHSGFHKDPADRPIVAAARDESARLLTSDRQILEWAGSLERIDAGLWLAPPAA